MRTDGEKKGFAGTAALLRSNSKRGRMPKMPAIPRRRSTPVENAADRKACRGGRNAVGPRSETSIPAIVPEATPIRKTPAVPARRVVRLLLSKGAAGGGDVMDDAVIKGLT